MRITRKNFLKGGATAIAACIGLAETRCSDDDAPPAQSPGGTGGVSGSAGAQGSTGSGVCSNLDADIETDHPHDLVIPTADIVPGLARSYRMSGDHDHTVMMRAISTEDDGHTHLVELRCA